MHLLISIFVSVAILALCPSLVRANSLSFFEQFNDSELINWKVVQNTGSGNWTYCLDVLSPAKWRIDQGWAKLVVDGISCTLAIAPINSNIFVGENWQIDFDWRLDESIDMDRNFVWWWEDSHNWYDLKLYGTGIHLQKVVAGKVFFLEKNHTTYPFQNNQTYHWTIKYQKKQISIFINDQLILTTPDSEPFLSKSQTLALKTSLGSRRSVSSFDNIRVNTIDYRSTLELSVPLIKQTDTQWSQLEYDKAKTWSENWTIERWGCALASAAMLLNYHQYTAFPDGQPINPLTLNSWLLSQPDGYIGDGLLNWQAISRLTSILGLNLALPKLEYQRLDLTNLESAAEILAKKLPLIVNIPGHFLVANGYTNEPLDLIIQDPAYNYHLLSEHQQKPTSLRLFSPSYTDLSYLIIVTNPDLKVLLDTQENQSDTQIEVDQYLESVKDELGEQLTSSRITTIKKPQFTNYRLIIENSTNLESNFSIYTYNQTGQLQVDQNTARNNSISEWQINLNPKTESPNTEVILEKISPNDITSWQGLLVKLKQYQTTDLNLTWHYYEHLLKLAVRAEQSSVNEQKRYQILIKYLLTNYSLLSENKNNLLKTLNSLNLVI